MSPVTPLLALNNIEVIYDRVFLAVKGVSIDVPKGGLVTLLGANGAGKSTALKAISGLLAPERGEVTRGTITFAGESILALDPPTRVRRGIVQVLEGRRVFGHLTPMENLLAAVSRSRARSHTKTLIERTFAWFPRLAERAKAKAGYLSGGEQQMLAIGRALMTNPRLLLLDEAPEGLAPLLREEIWRTIRLIRTTGMTTLIIDKSVAAVTAIADRIVILVKGEIVFQGRPDELKAQPDLMHRHLGV